MTDYFEQLLGRGVSVGLARLQGEVVDQIVRAGGLGPLTGATFLEVDDGVEAFRRGTFGAGRPTERGPTEEGA